MLVPKVFSFSLFFVLSPLRYLCLFRSFLPSSPISFSPLSLAILCFPSPQLVQFGSMKPITIVKHFLKCETPSIPLPPGIDDEIVSNPSTESWLLISQSFTRQVANLTKEAECQIQSALQSFTAIPDPASNAPWVSPLVPSFKLESKVPNLTMAGSNLQVSIVLQSHGSVTPHQRYHRKKIFLKPTPNKSLPSPTSFRKALTHLQSTADKDLSESERAPSQLREVFYEIQFSAKLFCEIQNSEYLDQHIGPHC